MSTIETTDRDGRPIPEDWGVNVCYWCEEDLYDGSEESGYTGDGPDWASGLMVDGRFLGGDFGCDQHPVSGEDGVGPHETEEEVRAIVTAWHGCADKPANVETVGDLVGMLLHEPRDRPVRIQTRAGRERRSIRGVYADPANEAKLLIVGY